MNKKLLLTTIIFAVLTIIARIMPHVPNVAPMAALALFAGVYVPRRWSIAVPMAAMLLSDLVVGFYEWQVMVAVYAGFALTAMIGWQVSPVRSRARASGASSLDRGAATSNGIDTLKIFGGSLSASVIFFLLTNAATWAFTQMYPHTFAGLMDSYVMALPFFKFSLVGDLAWTTVFFAAYQAVLKYFPRFSLHSAPASAIQLTD